MKTIETGNSSFEKIITNNNLYVDKTKYLCNLLSDGRTFYFLSRPRRFGKSLTLSTLEAIFKGKRELFKGLFIDSTDYDWKEYPVLHIDFSSLGSRTPETLEEDLVIEVLKVAKAYNVEVPELGSAKTKVKAVIEGLSQINEVVVLIDEYDSILTRNINNDKLEEIRDVFRDFFDVIKALSSNIRFCFITGVTKFSKVSIFSAMNNLVDISVLDEYSALLGYTQEELEDNFAEYLDAGAKKNNISKEEYLSQLKYWYDGYHFTSEGQAVYNPVSIGSFFYAGGEIFRNYWIQTGGMTSFLTEIAKRVKFDLSLSDEIRISEDKLHSVDIIQMVQTEVSKENFIALLYQSGYLTIKASSKGRSGYLLTLGYPNEEVEQGLNEILLPAYVGSAARSFDKLILLDLFDHGKVQEAMEMLSSIFASIPYYELVFDSESAWHAGFVCMMNMLEADIIPEVPTNKGRIDCVIKSPNDVYIIEFKFNQSAEVAIQQIKENKYYEPYLSSGKVIHLLGINFSTEKKNIVEWKDQVL